VFFQGEGIEGRGSGGGYSSPWRDFRFCFLLAGAYPAGRKNDIAHAIDVGGVGVLPVGVGPLVKQSTISVVPRNRLLLKGLCDVHGTDSAHWL